MLRYLVVCIFAVMLTTLSVGQSFRIQSVEFGLKGGLSNYQGDLVKESLNIGETHLALGVFARVFPFKKVGIEFNINTLKITGNDRNYTKQEDAGRYDRALKMENRILELSGRALYYPWMHLSPMYNAWMKFQPYIGTGFGIAVNNPKLTDQNINNGIILPQKNRVAPTIPFVFGLKYFFRPDLSVAAQSTFNVTLTDKLDGYVFFDNNDWFMFHSISIAKNFSFGLAYNATREKKKSQGYNRPKRKRRRMKLK